MPPKKKTTTTPKAKVKSSTKNITPRAKKPSLTPAKKPTVKKTATRKPTAKKKPELKPKRKKLSHEEMFPFETFPFRLEYIDGNDTRICHFQCEEHRDKLINRYKLRKGSYFIDNAT